MNWTTFISSDPAILYGKPAIKGTRIGVDLVLEKLAAGHTVQQLLKSYPHLKEEQIYACLAFAAEKIKNEVVDTLDDLPTSIVTALEAAELDDDLSDVIPNEQAFKSFHFSDFHLRNIDKSYSRSEIYGDDGR